MSEARLVQRELLAALRGLRRGDFTARLPDDLEGVDGQICEAFNDIAERVCSIESEVAELRDAVGREGQTGRRLQRGDLPGGWGRCVLSINELLDDLTAHTDNIARVVDAVANGDFRQQITITDGKPLRGHFLQHAQTVNGMVDQLAAIGSEVTRVAQAVGVDGKLGAQARVKGVGGAWKELTDGVNLMARNLTSQVREIARVTTAVAQGDLTKTVSMEVHGEILELKNTINTMVEQLRSFADEVTRVAREVGTEGQLGGQANVRGVSGVWRELTENVNSMANNLTEQVRNISQVATAIAQGDLQKKIVVDANGEILALKNTINTMVDQLGSFAEQVTRVAREVGTEGKLGGQASVEGVRGIWKELTDNVNLMASNLTNQVRDIARVSTAIAQGNLGKKITVEVRGELLDLKDTINTMVDQLSSFAEQVTRVARDVGVEGKLGGQAEVRGVSGIWKELTDNVNLMASNLTNQVRDIADVTTAVATGDLSRKITVEVRGEILELKQTINTMVDQLSAFAAEVTRVAREVGTDGILGGQAEVRGVSGMWRELTDNVNVMARNLTEQVRDIARVVTAVADGDLRQKLRLDAKGEIATLVDTIDNMIGTLSTFADQVTGVARDVGVEGRLGGQADVPGAAGIWRDLTNNVNELAGNLTRQVRAIGDVATAVTKGDLTQSITVEARGEVALLKDNINQMIGTLAETTRLNQEQDWLKTNLTRFTRMLQGQRDLSSVAQQVLTELAPVVQAQAGAFYMSTPDGDDEPALRLYASYAMAGDTAPRERFVLGEGLIGQAAVSKKRIVVTDAPAGYVRIGSALGETAPRNVVVVPILFEDEVKGVVELASVHELGRIQLAFLDQLLESFGIVAATIEATMRTDELLRQSQKLAEELQNRQDELQTTNAELAENAEQLTRQKAEVERKNREVELARQELEEKAEQLALTSRYKSQFLANMSHELRTPLNSLLILSRQLSDNPTGNLSPTQIEYARTVYQAGVDLLELINEILDLAKIESGTIAIHVEELHFDDLRRYVERSFQQIAQHKGLEFAIELDPALPSQIATDDMRLKQVLRNLLSNAFKFTESGRVTLRIGLGPRSGADGAIDTIAFAVIDTGIGIPGDQHRTIFEAFQQADGGTSRRYGGTGLGLSISREIAKLLGGELEVDSEPGRGSTFTLYLPAMTRAAEAANEDELTPIPAIALSDDRERIEPGDRVALIIARDELAARAMLAAARSAGFRGVVALEGGQGLELARTLQPAVLALEDGLADMDAWVVLDRIKHTPETRHIAVLFVGDPTFEYRALAQGVVEFVSRPIESGALAEALDRLDRFVRCQIKRLLLVEGQESSAERIADFLDEGGFGVLVVDSGEAALERLESDSDIGCVVVDLRSPEVGGLELLRVMRERTELRRVPIVVYTGVELGETEREQLAGLADSVIIKDVDSPEQVLAATALYLHRAEESLPASQREILRRVWHTDPALQDRRVLVVDDDIRNIFAIMALLERYGVDVSYAENGQEALELIEREEPDLVLMDIMMPEMDGYEATRRIRQRPEWRDLPIIALTAKAMKGDREKCLQAGASDYITKPVDPDQLVSLLRVWLGARPLRADRAGALR